MNQRDAFMRAYPANKGIREHDLFEIYKGLYVKGNQRVNIKPGMKVAIVLKADQHSGKLTEGVVKDIIDQLPHSSVWH